MRFDMRTFLENVSKPYSCTVSEDLSKMDFPGFRALGPVSGSFTAELVLDGIAMTLTLHVVVEAACARCLEPLSRTYDFTRSYLVKPMELDDPDFELPLDPKGCLDLTELMYQEVIFEVPSVLLCSPDCLGLCPICGKKKAAGCSCQPADNAAPADARLSILKQLLS